MPLELFKDKPTPFDTFSEFWLGDARDWCNGRMWYMRLPLWLYLAYVGVNQFTHPISYNSLFGGINLGIHEGGHLLFRPFGQFIYVAGGTIAQLSAPMIAMFLFFKQRDYFGMAVCWGWLSTNLISVGVYMADARDMLLPLVTVGGGGENGIVGHDWRYLFTALHLLEHDQTLGFFTRALGTGAMLVSLIAGAWLMFEMARSNGQRTLAL